MTEGMAMYRWAVQSILHPVLEGKRQTINLTSLDKREPRMLLSVGLYKEQISAVGTPYSLGSWVLGEYNWILKFLLIPCTLTLSSWNLVMSLKSLVRFRFQKANKAMGPDACAFKGWKPVMGERGRESRKQQREHTVMWLVLTSQIHPVASVSSNFDWACIQMPSFRAMYSLLIPPLHT